MSEQKLSQEYLDLLRVGDRVKLHTPLFDQPVILKGTVIELSPSDVRIKWNDGSYGRVNRDKQVTWDMERER
jgi:hypothetical protein